MESGDRSDSGEQAAAERTVPDQADAGTNGELERVRRTSAFVELVRRRKKFLIPIVIFYLAFYMLWPILAEFTMVLDGQVTGSMTWALVYGFAQTIMVLVVTHLFLRQANNWDRLVEKARREANEGRPNA